VEVKQIMDGVSRAFELVGIAVLVIGFLTGLIVLIRTFLSFSLQIEIEGMVPWRRWRLMAPGPPPPERRNDTG